MGKAKNLASIVFSLFLSCSKDNPSTAPETLSDDAPQTDTIQIPEALQVSETSSLPPTATSTQPSLERTPEHTTTPPQEQEPPLIDLDKIGFYLRIQDSTSINIPLAPIQPDYATITLPPGNYRFSTTRAYQQFTLITPRPGGRLPETILSATTPTSLEAELTQGTYTAYAKYPQPASEDVLSIEIKPLAYWELKATQRIIEIQKKATGSADLGTPATKKDVVYKPFSEEAYNIRVNNFQPFTRKEPANEGYFALAPLEEAVLSTDEGETIRKLEIFSATPRGYRLITAEGYAAPSVTKRFKDSGNYLLRFTLEKDGATRQDMLFLAVTADKEGKERALQHYLGIEEIPPATPLQVQRFPPPL